jgi:hypothetical protein
MTPSLLDIPEEFRAKLKRSIANPDYSHWSWDWGSSSIWYGDLLCEDLPEYNEWMLPLYDDIDYDFAEVCLIPLAEGGEPLEM